MANKFINMLKENWIGALIGGFIGIKGFCAKLVAEKVPTVSNYFVEKAVDGCIFKSDTIFGSCSSGDFRYKLLAIVILIVIGAYIQSKVRKK